MNTSKSLDSILLKLEDYYNTVYNGVLPSKDAMDRARAKQAIVEAVEGLIPPAVRYNDETVPKYLKPAIGENWQQAIRHEQGYNQCREEVLQAIKEWQ